MRGKSGGFTLTELMIVVVIIAVLAAIAVPAYQNYTREARRTDAHQALLAIANAQEKVFPAGNTYVTNLTTLGRTDTPSGSGTFLTDAGHYTLTVPTANTTTFTVQAVALTTSSQNADTSPVDCRTMTINAANQRLPAACWGG